MKHLLIIAYYFPPVAASGSFRILGFCRYLERYGWRPRVLAADPGSIYPLEPIDEQLCERLPATVQVDHVSYRNPLHDFILVRNELRQKLHRILKIPVAQTTGNAAQKKNASSSLKRFAAFKNVILDRLFSFPDPQCFWLRSVVRWSSSLSAADVPNLVFATGGPWTSLIVGKTLATKFRVPLVTDFRDPWIRNPNAAAREPYFRSKLRSLEQSVIAASSKVVVNTAELRDQFIIDYAADKDKFITITNGFDVKVSGNGYILVQGMSSGIELSHFGSIYGNRNPSALFQAIVELMDENRMSSGQLRIRLVGEWDLTDANCEALAVNLEKNGFLKREPRIPHETYLREMACAQYLLLLQPDYPLQIPAKIYEYISVARPIVVIGGEGATATLIQRHRLGECCPNCVPAIKAFLMRLISGELRIQPPRPESTDSFHYRTLTRQLAEVFDDVSKSAGVD